MSRGGFLFAECLLESLLSVSDELPITLRVDKNMGTIWRIALQFGEHVEVPTMGSQKYVAGQSTQHRKGMLEILNDAGVAYGVAGRNDIVGNAHTPAWVGWLGSLVPGSFGNIDQRIIGRSIAAEIALHSRETGEVTRENAAMKKLAAQFNSVL